MSKQVGDYFWTKIKENYHINDSKFSSSHSKKVFSYTWLLSNSLDQSGHQQHHTTRPIEFLLDAGFGLPLNVEHCCTILKQIYPVSEGYLQKIPVERRGKFPELSPPWSGNL
jgi:hypothetical protein